MAKYDNICQRMIHYCDELFPFVGYKQERDWEGINNWLENHVIEG